MNKIKVIIIFLIILHCISFTRETDNKDADKKVDNNDVSIKDVRKEPEIIKQSIIKPIEKAKEIKENINEVLLMIEIDKISLKRPVYRVDNKENVVDKNVAIMKESNMPDIESGNLILGAHSGDGPLAYFNDLIKLRKNDEIDIAYDNKIYTYEVASIYDDIKDNRIVIKRDMKRTTLTLFTCKNNEKNKYLVVIAYLKKG